MLFEVEILKISDIIRIMGISSEQNHPMVGREIESEMLLNKLGSALSGDGGLILISGEAGTGKTRLCSEYEELASKLDCKVLIGRCVPDAPVPYLPFQEAFHDQLSNPLSKRNELSELETERLFFSVLDDLEKTSRDQTISLRLEDLHWADSSTIALLHFLARNVRTLNILIIGTYRPEECIIESPDRINPFLDTLRIMREENVCSEVHLEPLDPNATRELVQGMLGGIAEPTVIEVVVDEGRGIPLFTIEMIRFLLSNGSIVSHDGVWGLKEKRMMPIPSTIAELINRRVERVNKGERRILDCASVIGEWFDPELIEITLGDERNSILEALEDLEQKFDLVIESGKMYRFSHEKIRQFLYESISCNRRRELHRALGLALEDRLPDEGLLSQLSWHFNEAGEIDKCINYSLMAGESCLSKKAFKEARVFFQMVLERTNDDPKYLTERLRALEGMGDMGIYGATPKEWFAYYEEFLDLNHDRRARARVLVKAAECWDQFALHDVDVANGFLDEAESYSEICPNDKAMLEMHRASLLYNDRHFNRSIGHLVRAIEYYEKVGNLSGVLEGMHMEVGILAWTYRLGEARDYAETRYRKAIDYGDPVQLMGSAIQLSHICVRRGEVDLAIKYSSEGLGLAQKLGSVHWMLEALIVRGRAMQLRGNLGSAERNATEAHNAARSYDQIIFIVTTSVDLGLYEIELGFIDKAEGHYREALDMFSKLEEKTKIWQEGDLAILDAELLFARGSYKESDALYEYTIQLNREKGRLLDLENSLLRYCITLAKRGLDERARKLMSQAIEVAKKIGCEERANIYEKKLCQIIS
jgi:tetratricopeptide (TPR) repeat protein